MIIVVACESCHSRFRLKKSLLGGAFAIRFRCRTCGGFIVVRNPEMHKIAELPAPPIPDSSLSPEVPGAPASPPEPEMHVVSSGHAPAVESEESGGSAVDAMTAFPGETGPGATRLEDLVPFEPERGGRTEPGTIGGTDAAKRVVTGTRSTAFKKRAWVIGAISFFAGLGILFLANGLYYVAAFKPLGISPAKKATFPLSLNAATAPLKPAYDVQNLDAYIPREAIAGNLFVIAGTVKNVGNASSRGIRIQATLFGKDHQVLDRQASIAGNFIDKFTLPHMMRTAIEGHLTAARYEAETGNHDIPPGNSLPFIVVCFNPPGQVETYEVIATNADL